MKRYLGALAACAVLAAPASSAQAADKLLRLVMVDVEGGAATLFVTPEGKSVLVDAGWPAGMGGARPVAGEPAAPSSAERVRAAAAELGVRKIDYLIMSHYHVDHVGGVQDLLAAMPVGEVIDHGPNREELRAGLTPDMPAAATQPAVLYRRYLTSVAKRPHRVAKPGDTLKVGSLSLTFVTSDGAVIDRTLTQTAVPTPGCDAMADKDQDGGVENARSLGFVAVYGKARILAMADATWDVEKQLVCPTNRLGRIDLLLVSHHGSGLSNSPQLMAAVAPRVALVANGPRKGGDKVVLETLRDAPSHPVVWQMHAALRSPEVDRPQDYIANLADRPDAGYAIKALISADGTLRISNARQGFTQQYPPNAP